MSTGADRRVLDEAGGLRAMTWVMGIMLFLTVLAAALGLATRTAERSLGRQLAGRMTVQVIEADPATRDALAARVLAALRATPMVRRAASVDRAELARLLRPWLGADGADPALPVPAMVDVDLADPAAAPAIAASLHRLGPNLRIDRHERWMSPVGDVMMTLVWLALALVAMMVAASGAVVMLAARAGLAEHRATIEVMHMLGSTDVQVARLFQRRIAIDAAVGGFAGALLAIAAIAAIGARIAALDSELLGRAVLGPSDWALLAALPFAFVALAILAARRTVIRALRRSL